MDHSDSPAAPNPDGTVSAAGRLQRPGTPVHLWHWGVFAVLIVVGVAAEYTGFDLWLAGHFYDRAAGLWLFREHWLFKGVLHEGAKLAVRVIAAVFIIATVVSYAKPKYHRFRRQLSILLGSYAAAPAIIGIIKATTHIYTPWSLSYFGADKPYVRMFDAAPHGLKVGHAFPAAHASGGYALVGLYFFLLAVNPRWSKAGLAAALLAGIALGGAQQVRGAHFFSHDAISLAICWGITLVMNHFFAKPLATTHCTSGCAQ